ncbi:hypothetical protein P175DRAFT_0499243 [Aspergillus ochraceoroseus IBT 24754]|uniref:Translation initiation factor IF3 n=3 Tax=Aspergillus subgen. Nidulantes TaxID=2720870 RepID=A0A0F8VG40_9EURO|nr:uncharacterized protein P175DRAFT_0499243 [Aspergillus ochraceoroseus IBT 24754]KKK14169.1 hypothetical protein AOCH_003272 [Aspergillus ochraceoroseus]KKK22091.1 hypothetical protein ARAM_002508 [Aspergillus rambellii]PTU22700.1 hypothetical protein P175DRAFT_0499243 [Aspergillus ochraceoroseus IBT 24754]
MTHMRGLISTTQALRRIFLVPQSISRVPFARYSPKQSPLQNRLLHSTSSRLRPYAKPAETPGQARDEDIRAEYVQIVNENNSLDPPMRLSHALRSFDRTENFLLQVSPGTRDQPAVCKIVNRLAMREHERAKAKAAHTAKMAVKQIELNWAIDPHDLSHRLKQLTTFLDKGRKVEIILTRKKGKRAPTIEEVKNVMDKVLQVTKDANAMQVKPMEGEPGKHVILFVKKRDS